jgi:hypothetical protein
MHSCGSDTYSLEAMNRSSTFNLQLTLPVSMHHIIHQWRTINFIEYNDVHISQHKLRVTVSGCDLWTTQFSDSSPPLVN